MAMDKQTGSTDREVAFAITVAFELEEGAFDTFFRLVKENAAQSVKLEPGCIRFDVLVPLAAPGSSVLLYEIYATREDFTRHLSMPHYLSFDEATRAMVLSKTVANF